MKTLLLLRHAQALPSSATVGDFERSLSPKGIEDARKLGEVLKAQDLSIDLIKCSSANRTQQTTAEVCAGLEQNIHTENSKSIYNASAGDLFKMIQDTDDKVDTLMIVGHNPTVYELVSKLAATGSNAVFDSLAHGYSPATLTIIETGIESWAEINPDQCEAKAVFDPSDYNAPERPTRWM
ncbi:MAG: histidine phosphatase family protein [Alphaproteobacteria bacterium]|nr:histidine phosphatase family protein [Alphaproteobacteria bacterium]